MSVEGVDNVVQIKTFILNDSQKMFVNFIRTKMIFTLRLRGEGDQIQPVHIKSTDIEERFFPFPRFKRKEQVQELIDSGEIKVTTVDKRFYYEALKPGQIDFSLLVVKPLPKDPVYTAMLNNIKTASLPKAAESTEYFDLFLKYKDSRPELFFRVDDFAKRVHTPISNFHRHLRPLLLINNEETTSLDVVTMQPLLLGKILTKYLVDNEYSKWINDGEDIYIKLQNKAKLKTRDEAKKKFFEILFSKPTQDLARLFGAADWITWINSYKTQIEPLNPHGKNKPHSNLAWLLQTTEVKIMKQVWEKLIQSNITFLPVHDEIIIPISKVEKARQIMVEVFSKEFSYFNISGEKKVTAKTTSSTPCASDEIKKPYSSIETKINAISAGVDKIIPTPNTNWIVPCFDGLNLPKSLSLGQGVTINDVAKCIASHLPMVTANIGNKAYLPYLKRLQSIHSLIVNAP